MFVKYERNANNWLNNSTNVYFDFTFEIRTKVVVDQVPLLNVIHKIAHTNYFADRIIRVSPDNNTANFSVKEYLVKVDD